ncbi:hypothetical protein EV715DRAFT_272872 [Schizophyllum commune]
MDHHHQGAMNTVAGLQHLVDDVINHPDFEQSHFAGFNAEREIQRLDDHVTMQHELASLGDLPWTAASGWHVATLRIPVPCTRRKCPESEAPVFEVPNFWYRKIQEVIKEALQDEQSLEYHFQPHKLHWRRQENELPMRCWGEAYTSNRALEMDEELERLRSASECALEHFILWLMAFSDSTHLTNFGIASMWPIYLSFGNLSKYARGKPSTFSQHHLAYIPPFPDSFEDWYIEVFGTKPSDYIKTYMKRELMQRVWGHLLDDEFVAAYEHGIVVGCADGVLRRSFPRFFTYSSDYLEKILLVCVKSLGTCLCPRCLITQDRVCELGMTRDTKRRQRTRREDTAQHRWAVKKARNTIFNEGVALNSKRIDGILGNNSSTPIENAFSQKLHRFGFDHYRMHPVDMLHDFEVGVWKSIFAHLVRMLHSVGGDVIEELNRRYRAVPTFLKETIRRFANNVAEMKKLAGRDFEDILQDAIPSFEKLFPNRAHQKIILDMLFDLAHWHGLAKLRLHTDSTIASLRYATRELGQSLRRFETISQEYDTRELPREKAARMKRAQKEAGPSRRSGSHPNAQEGRRRGFNMRTYKLHSLGDYADAIEYWGTIDSYSTQIGEMEHRRVKRAYARTNKVRPTVQIVRRERRGNQLRKMRQQEKKAAGVTKAPRHLMTVAAGAHEKLPCTEPTVTVHISNSLRFPESISSFLADNIDDLALTEFLPKLKEHLLGRLRGSVDQDSEYTVDQRNEIVFENDRLYKHKVIQLNYTTYDLRREQDSLNPNSQADIYVLSHDDDGHPYWYGRLLGVFHAKVYDLAERAVKRSTPVEMQFAYVRWYRLERTPWGFAAKRQPRVRFLDAEDPEAFGFIDPKDIVRAAHIVPAFAYGKTNEYLPGETIARAPGDQEDWKFYYVSMFADRDTLMRFRGGGVGHLSTREATRKLEEEAERLAGFRQIPAGEVSEDVTESSDEEGEIEAPGEDVAEGGAGDGVEDAGSDGSAFSDGDQGSGDEEEEEVGEESSGWEDEDEGAAEDLTVGDLGYGHW